MSEQRFTNLAEAELYVLEHPGSVLRQSPRGSVWFVEKPDPTAIAIDALMKDKRAHRPIPAPTVVEVAPLRADLMTYEFPPYRYSWEPYFPLRASAALVAEGKVGKSMLALAQQLHGAAGKPYLEAPTRDGVYVYLSAEDDREIIERRAQKILATFTPDERARVQKNFRLIDAVGKGLQFVMCADGMTGIAPTVDKIIEAIKADAGTRAVVQCVADTVSRLNGGQENDTSVMAAVEQAGARIAQALDCSFVWLHHVSKAVAREGVADAHAGRGAGSFGDNCRSVLRLMPLTWAMVAKLKLEGLDRIEVERGDVLVLIHAALNQGRKADPVYLRRGPAGLLERITPTVRSEAQAADDEMVALVKWFNGRKCEPFTISAAARTGRLEWTRMGKHAAVKFVEDAVRDGRLVKQGESRGGATYVPSEEALTRTVHRGDAWLDDV